MVLGAGDGTAGVPGGIGVVSTFVGVATVGAIVDADPGVGSATGLGATTTTLVVQAIAVIEVIAKKAAVSLIATDFDLMNSPLGTIGPR